MTFTELEKHLTKTLADKPIGSIDIEVSVLQYLRSHYPEAQNIYTKRYNKTNIVVYYQIYHQDCNFVNLFGIEFHRTVDGKLKSLIVSDNYYPYSVHTVEEKIAYAKQEIENQLTKATEEFNNIQKATQTLIWENKLHDDHELYQFLTYILNHRSRMDLHFLD